MDATKLQTIGRFQGINNVDSNLRLSPVQIDTREYSYLLQQANNVDIDNSHMIKSRGGYTNVLTGSDIHSLWSDGYDCFFCDGSSLNKLDLSYNKTLIRSNLQSKARMSYVTVNDRIYYTNYFQIGYIHNDIDNAILSIDLDFKEPLPAGQHIALFNSCIYVARDNIIYISDPLCDYYDVRYGYKIFGKRINMLLPVDNGIYVSTDSVGFMKGLTNEDFELYDAYSFPAIEFTDAIIESSFISGQGGGKLAVWTSTNGICIGDGDGKVINATDSVYTLDSFTQGACLVRDSNNVRHYINTLY